MAAAALHAGEGEVACARGECALEVSPSPPSPPDAHHTLHGPAGRQPALAWRRPCAADCQLAASRPLPPDQGPACARWIDVPLERAVRGRLSSGTRSSTCGGRFLSERPGAAPRSAARVHWPHGAQPCIAMSDVSCTPARCPEIPAESRGCSRAACARAARRC